MIYSAVPPWERVVTVEAAITELGLHRSGRLKNVVALFSRPPGTEGEGEVTVWDIVEYSRRLNATRVFVGEVLGKEVGPVLDAFTSSTPGSACTIHARSARAVVGRFEQYGMAASAAVAAGGGATGVRQRPPDHRAPGQGRVHGRRGAALLHVDLSRSPASKTARSR